MTPGNRSRQVFSFTEPMPAGRLVIEASAGTGKTFALAGLATRFVAETNLAVADLLIVTFTRAATSELRSRTRQQLVDTAAQLSHPEIAEPDEVTAHLLAHPDPLHLPRLRRAVSDFDSATITTIHGFATQVLGTLGTMSGIDPDSVLIDDTAELTAEICADVVIGHAANGIGPDDLPPVERLIVATRKILTTPGIRTVPEPDDESVDIRARVITQLAREAVERIVRRRHGSGTMSFDDVLVRLRDALIGPGAASVAEALRGRFRVALIDEFQDTDPVQWDIFRVLFGDTDSETSLVLVGDPKQAIYSFRGADVNTYLEAVDPDNSVEVTHRSLTTNWRSDGAMLNAIETLLNGSTFGDEAIGFVPVEAAPDHEPLRIRGADDRPIPALSIRFAVGSDIKRTATKGTIQADSARSAIYDDLVTQIGELLADAKIPDDENSHRAPGDDHPYRRVSPSDIAVLVLNRRQAEDIRQRLVDNGIPAVLARGASVLGSPAATQWRWLLHAIARPADPARARTFALSWFGGHDIQWVQNSTDQQIADIQEMLQTWSETLLDRGLASLLRQIRRDTDVTAKVLSRADGDRDITDLDHVAELLHDTYSDGAMNASALLASLDSEPDTTAETDIDGDLTSRRVESEAEAVQIMTVWVAKGLEFPAVCIPTMWVPRGSARGGLVFHDPITGQRTFDVASVLGGKQDEPPRVWPDKKTTIERRRIAATEAAAEDLRLLYVALTRARHHTIVWWSHMGGTDKTAISKVLFGRTNGAVDPTMSAADKTVLPADDQVLHAIGPTIDRAQGDISAQVHGAAGAVVSAWEVDGPVEDLPLRLARLDRVPDRGRSRWSFSAIVNRVDYHPDPHDGSMSDSGASDEPFDDAPTTRTDEPSDETPSARTDDPMKRSSSDSTGAHGRGADSGGEAIRPVSPLANLPAGAAFGTLIHQVLEEIDFNAADLREDLLEAIDRRTRFGSPDLRPVLPVDATAADGRLLLAEGLETAINSPLGQLFEGLNLADIDRIDRLDEMSFELLLGEGSNRPSDRDIGRLVHNHLPLDDPLRGWAAALADGIFHVELAGHLTGSIDALIRVGDDSGNPRFVVVDYKSNRLHNPGSPPKPGDYSQSGMAKAMAQHHYPLQALLYSVAVHRYLRWRLPGYDPELHFGGIAYLFVRGMAGSDVDTEDCIPDGVFTWQPPPALIIALSDLLAGSPERRLNPVESR